MNLKDAITNLGVERAIEQAREITQELGFDWADGICFVFSAIANDSERVPSNIGGKNDNESTAIQKWILKYA